MIADTCCRHMLDSVRTPPYKPVALPRSRIRRSAAQVAQLVEHVTENHGVGGSIPPLGTNNNFDIPMT
jgi:hypothetical protein